MTLNDLRSLVAEGEGPRLEFKRTTGELREGLQTLCGMLNAKGGTVLFGVSPLDPLTYAIVPCVLVLCATLASYLPAHRAATLDPVEALRSE